MAVSRISTPHAYVGVSGDTKPTDRVPPGSSFIERDSGHEFIFDGTDWAQKFFPHTSGEGGGVPPDAPTSGMWSISEANSEEFVIDITSEPDFNGGTLSAVVFYIYNVTDDALIDDEYVVAKTSTTVAEYTLDLDLIAGESVNSDEISIKYKIRTNNGDSEWSDTKSDTPANPVLFSDDFSTDTSGDYSGTNATPSVVGGRLRATNTGSFYGRAYIAINGLSIGETYRWTADSLVGTCNPQLRVGTTVGGTQYDIDGTPGLGRTGTFVATATTVYLSFNNGSNVPGEYSEYDNVSLVQE